MNKLLITAALSASTQSKIQDQCKQGTDVQCVPYGLDFCCANIEYSFRGGYQSFHACASRVGIEYSNGYIYDDAGFSGYWFCDNAVHLLTIAATTALTLALV